MQCRFAEFGEKIREQRFGKIWMQLNIIITSFKIHIISPLEPTGLLQGLMSQYVVNFNFVLYMYIKTK